MEYDFTPHRCLMDIGGASGGWCMGVRRRFPHLRGMIFDLPKACEIATRSIAEAGEADHIRVVSGSFFSDDLPQGADVVLLANILHDWTEEDGRIILRRVIRALPAGGVVLVKEFYFEDGWTGNLDAVGQAFMVHGAEGKGGWQPTYGEMEQLLKEEGFANTERRHNLVIGKKPIS